MRMLDVDKIASPETAAWDLEAESLIIKEARRRQRRRYLATGLALVVLLAGVSAVFTNLSGARPAKSKTEPGTPTARAPLAIRGIDSSLIMWPVGAPVFTQDGGPRAYLENLRTGKLTQITLDISAGDYQPLVSPVGQWLVYVGDGATAIRDDLRGAARVLGTTPFFAPSATPESVWLESELTGNVSVRSVRVSGGPPGPPIAPPNGTDLVEGTDAGLLLTGGALDRLQLWTPGESPKTLPFSPSFSDGFAAGPLLIAYGSDCTNSVTSKAGSEPNAGYEACRILRVLNVVTGAILSFSTRQVRPDGCRPALASRTQLHRAIRWSPRKQRFFPVEKAQCACSWCDSREQTGPRPSHRRHRSCLPGRLGRPTVHGCSIKALKNTCGHIV